jgi:hypothetical protein
MLNKIFIQFYSKILNTHPIYPINIYELCNGFSDTLEYCKSIGEIFWVEHRVQKTTFGKSDTINDQKLPVKAKEIFVSVYYLSQLYQVVLWANENKESKFIVGGPVALPQMFELRGIIPKNIEITSKTVEEYFGLENFSQKWTLDIPPTEDDKRFSLAYTYTIDCYCYWGKCIFCNYFASKRKRPIIDFKKVPDFEGNQRINIYSPSLTSKLLLETIPQLPKKDKIRYDSYIRPTKPEREAMKTLLENDIPNLKFIIGVEFPSSKMLEYLKKGFTSEDLLEMINIISNRKEIVVALNFILGWNNIVKQDLIELEKFMKDISNTKGLVFNINKLFAKPYSIIHDSYEIEKEVNYGPFHAGFFPKLNEEQQKMNLEADSIINDLSKGTVYDYYKRL